MTPSDAANLLIAVAGTGVTKEAGAAIKAFRSLDRPLVWDRGDGPGRRLIKEWLTGLGPFEELPLKKTQPNPGAIAPAYRLKCTFGAFVTFLVEMAANAEFLEFLRTVLILEEPKIKRSPHLAGLMQFSITFNRSVTHTARVNFWHPHISEIFRINFDPHVIEEKDLRIETQVGSTTIAALGDCLAAQPGRSRSHLRH
jgi:hypothetical protein